MGNFIALVSWAHCVQKKSGAKGLKFGTGNFSMSFARRFAVRQEEITTTELHEAIAFGELSTVSHLLILPEVDPSIPGLDGKTPLQTAIEYGRVEIVRLLLKMPTVNPYGTVDTYNRTPLHIACWKGHGDIVQLLLATRPKLETILLSELDYCELKSKNDDLSSSSDHKETLRALSKAETDISIVAKEYDLIYTNLITVIFKKLL